MAYLRPSREIAVALTQLCYLSADRPVSQVTTDPMKNGIMADGKPEQNLRASEAGFRISNSIDV